MNESAELNAWIQYCNVVLYIYCLHHYVFNLEGTSEKDHIQSQREHQQVGCV